MIKLNQLQLLQIECYDTDVNPLKEDVEGRVREATRQCEQLNKVWTKTSLQNLAKIFTLFPQEFLKKSEKFYVI